MCEAMTLLERPPVLFSSCWGINWPPRFGEELEISTEVPIVGKGLGTAAAAPWGCVCAACFGLFCEVLCWDSGAVSPLPPPRSAP